MLDVVIFFKDIPAVITLEQVLVHQVSKYSVQFSEVFRVKFTHRAPQIAGTDTGLTQRFFTLIASLSRLQNIAITDRACDFIDCDQITLFWPVHKILEHFLLVDCEFLVLDFVNPNKISPHKTVDSLCVSQLEIVVRVDILFKHFYYLYYINL